MSIYTDRRGYLFSAPQENTIDNYQFQTPYSSTLTQQPAEIVPTTAAPVVEPTPTMDGTVQQPSAVTEMTLEEIVKQGQMTPMEAIAGGLSNLRPVYKAPTGKVALAQWAGQLGGTAMGTVADYLKQRRDLQTKVNLAQYEQQQAQKLLEAKSTIEAQRDLSDKIFNASPESKAAYAESVERGNPNPDLLTKGYANETGGREYTASAALIKQWNSATDESRELANAKVAELMSMGVPEETARLRAGFLLKTAPTATNRKTKDYTRVPTFNQATGRYEGADASGRPVSLSREQYEELAGVEKQPTQEAPEYKTLADLTPDVATQLKLNTTESQNLAWYTSAANAERAMNEAIAAGFDPTSAANAALLTAAAEVNKDGSPTVKSAAAYAALGPEGQKYASAANQYVETKGRKASGGAIPNPEQLNFARQDLPRFGDDEKSLNQKRSSRMSTIKGMASSTGKASEYTLGDYETTLKVLQQQQSARQLLEAAKKAGGGK